MVCSILFPEALSSQLPIECSTCTLWPVSWGAGPHWRPLGYVWYARGLKRWLTTLQAETGYFTMRCAHGFDIASMYVENRVVLRLDFDFNGDDGEV